MVAETYVFVVPTAMSEMAVFSLSKRTCEMSVVFSGSPNTAAVVLCPIDRGSSLMNSPCVPLCCSPAKIDSMK